MTKKKTKVVMPASIRSKMMGATAMLLVAAILMVSTTYAWFTLSTAPEVTGITTQVGANGNLEIALLTTATYANTNDITSSTGDSMSASSQKTTAANITWGNLIDLSDSSYGLSEISLLPAALNGTASLNATSPLLTPVYGADGRVASVEGNNTVSAVKTEGSFKVDAASQSYGVRAVGVSDSMSAKAIALRSAKSGLTSNVASAQSSIVTAINNNAAPFAVLATSSDTSITTLNTEQLKAVQAIAEAMQTSLDNIVSGYKNVVIAQLTQQSLSDTEFADAQTEINNVSSATELATLVNATNVTNKADIAAKLNALATDQTKVATAITTLSTAKANETILSSTVTDLLGENVPHTKDEGTTNYYLTGGVLNDIATHVSTFQLISAYGYTINAGAKGTTGTLTGLATTVSSLSVSSSSSEANIVETYGYVVDFAFRTNASSSNLLLQTEGENRVYSSETNSDLATQGAGSYLEFTYANGLTAAQATKLLEAVRVVFYNPETGAIYATAAAGSITTESASAKASLYLLADDMTATKATLGQDMYEKVEDQTYKYKIKEKLNVVVTNDTTTAEANTIAASATNCTNYKETLTEAEYKALQSKTTTTKYVSQQADKGVITALTQNTVQKVSALVYLDGENIDNTAVVNASSSGSLNLNLQFSSSADLVPMDNSALKTATAITATITETTAPTTSATGSYTVATSSTSKTIKSVAWSTGSASVATVTGSDATATVTGVAAGTTTLKAVVTLSDDSTVEVTKNIMVSAAGG